MKLALKNYMSITCWGYNFLSSTNIFVFIEGNDDELFLKEILAPLFKRKHIIPWQYSSKKKKKVIDFIKSIKAMGATYIFITDFDERDCLKTRITEIFDVFPNLDEEQIVIVKNEIESWYISGINNEIGVEITCPKRLRKISIPDDTEKITKEDFIKLMPVSFRGSKIDFMQEIIKYYNKILAKNRNNSFKCFIDDFVR